MQAPLPYYFTATERRTLLSSLVVLVDTREQANTQITGYLEEQGVQYRQRALDYGDYSLLLPAAPELGIMRDVYFTSQLVIERKASLEELSRCFAQDRQRFENELIRASGCRVVLLVEDATYGDILRHNYRTEYNPKSFLATLHTFTHRYGLQVTFLPRELSGHWIYWHCRYFLREWLK